MCQFHFFRSKKLPFLLFVISHCAHSSTLHPGIYIACTVNPWTKRGVGEPMPRTVENPRITYRRPSVHLASLNPRFCIRGFSQPRMLCYCSMYSWKTPANKWTHVVQNCVVQGSTVISFPVFSCLFVERRKEARREGGKEVRWEEERKKKT